MCPAPIKGAERNITKIFSDDYAFTIPNYQRPYAWTTEEACELFDDLLAAMDDSAKGARIKDLNPYFLGSVVLIKDDIDPKSQVVDGQQRLVTLTILLSAIRFLVGEKQAVDISKRIYEKGESMDAFILSLLQLALSTGDRCFLDYLARANTISTYRHPTYYGFEWLVHVTLADYLIRNRNQLGISDLTIGSIRGNRKKPDIGFIYKGSEIIIEFKTILGNDFNQCNGDVDKLRRHFNGYRYIAVCAYRDGTDTPPCNCQCGTYQRIQYQRWFQGCPDVS